jgi:hypothetical protein
MGNYNNRLDVVSPQNSVGNFLGTVTSKSDGSTLAKFDTQTPDGHSYVYYGEGDLDKMANSDTKLTSADGRTLGPDPVDAKTALDLVRAGTSTLGIVNLPSSHSVRPTMSPHSVGSTMMPP